jgi:hypothetical protein
MAYKLNGSYAPERHQLEARRPVQTEARGAREQAKIAGPHVRVIGATAATTPQRIPPDFLIRDRE